ncbi:T-complex protein 1 [Culex quinquefasciatus]|uniref:T-complex protein 1 n=1 Tax=Culex quinquefasciatus TaxID=7176 RepID=B0X4Z7_CULQU|nr:T-complex protein 1 [Culex quinquefasciatus]|eukprot:XP_001864719.1 T-complex protein 1 [Culex quinquefasciatus]
MAAAPARLRSGSEDPRGHKSWKRDEVGDGTTSVTVLASELLREAEKLIEQKLHPQTIIAGWRATTKATPSTLITAAHDNSKEMEKFLEDLMNIAWMTLRSKILSQQNYFAKLAVDAVIRGIEIKVFGSSIKMDSMAKIAEKEKMKEKVITRTRFVSVVVI